MDRILQVGNVLFQMLNVSRLGDERGHERQTAREMRFRLIVKRVALTNHVADRGFRVFSLADGRVYLGGDLLVGQSDLLGQLLPLFFQVGAEFFHFTQRFHVFLEFPVEKGDGFAAYRRRRRFRHVCVLFFQSLHDRWMDGDLFRFRE